MRGKVGGLSPPYFKSRGAIAPLLPTPLIAVGLGIPMGIPIAMGMGFSCGDPYKDPDKNPPNGMGI